MWGRGVLLLAAFATAGLLADASRALAPMLYVRVTSQGPQPKVLHAVAGFNPVAWYGDGVRGRRVVFAGGECRVRVVGRSGVQTGCYFAEPGRYAYRIEGLPGPVASGVVIVRAARPGERYCGGPCPRK